MTESVSACAFSVLSILLYFFYIDEETKKKKKNGKKDTSNDDQNNHELQLYYLVTLNLSWPKYCDMR